MDYLQLKNKIKAMVVGGNSSSDICKTLKIKPYEFYNIVKRENINYDKQPLGKQLGAKDKKQRKRRSKRQTQKIKQGGALEQLQAQREKDKKELEGEIDEYGLNLQHKHTIRLYDPTDDAEKFIREQDDLLNKQLSALKYKYKHLENE